MKPKQTKRASTYALTSGGFLHIDRLIIPIVAKKHEHKNKEFLDWCINNPMSSKAMINILNKAGWKQYKKHWNIWMAPSGGLFRGPCFACFVAMTRFTN